MHEAVMKMLERYETRNLGDSLHALREILQELALLGLWRSKFFEKTAFYGGTALRILHGLDRFSEDMDFSLLRPMKNFDLTSYLGTLKKEIDSFGFEIRTQRVEKVVSSPVQSAFLKADTRNQLILIETGEEIVNQVPKGKVLKIRLEIDTDPPPGFETESKYLLSPVPFPVRSYKLPDLFAGKMHALLCRTWKGRVKGRDWYDLVWYAAHHPDLRLTHLEQRMRQTGHWRGEDPLTPLSFEERLSEAIENLDVAKAKEEVLPFLRNPEAVSVWSKKLFREVAARIRPV